MTENPFASVLTEELTAREQAHASLKTLQQFCQGIEYSTANRVTCSLERGYATNYGQEWRPVLRSVLGGSPHLLFRAYVPDTDWPVVLDLHQGALTTAHTDQQLTEILQGFLRDPNVVEQIRYVMAYPTPVRTE